MSKKPASSARGAPSAPAGASFTDERFAYAHSDPRFQTLKKNKMRRTTVDKRFAAVLKDKDFQSGATVDKFGRKIVVQSRNVTSKFDVEDDEDEEEEEEEKAPKQKQQKKTPQPSSPSPAAGVASDSDAAADEADSDSSTDIGTTTDDDSDDSDEDAAFLPGGIAGSAAEVTHTATSRLAAVNLEWEQLSAVDIFAMLQSFLPPRGSLKRVSVYASQFGKERMAEEAKFGPVSLFASLKDSSIASMADKVQQRVTAAAAAAAADDDDDDLGSDIDDEAVLAEMKAVAKKDGFKDITAAAIAGESLSDDDDEEEESAAATTDAADEEDGSAMGMDDDDDDDDSDSDADALGGNDNNDDDEDGSGFDQEKLRAYELSKLRYYFAVAEFDSAATAHYIYKEADGLEFERTSNVLDLRFIPEEQAFAAEDMRDTATKLPVNYTPPQFQTTALQQSKVKCTWDREDPRRAKALRRQFTKADFDGDDLDIFMADEEDEEAEGTDVPVTDPDANTDTSSDSPSDSDSDDEDKEKGKGKGDGKKRVLLKRRARAAFSSILGEVRNDGGGRVSEADKRRKKILAKANARAAKGSDVDSDEDDEEDSESESESESEDSGAEIVFQPALQLAAERIAAAAMNKDKDTQRAEAKTAWQQFLDKRKEKKKEHKRRGKEAAAAELQARREGAIYAKGKGSKGSKEGDIVAKHNSESLFDDDAVDYDPNDEFFRDAFKDGDYAPVPGSTSEGKKGGKAKRSAPSAASDDEDGDSGARAAEKARLEMLVGGEGNSDTDSGNETGKGYTLKSLLRQQKLKKKAEARKVISRKEQEQALIDESLASKAAGSGTKRAKFASTVATDAPAGNSEDGFVVDVHDDRISSIFNDPAFAIDPTSAAFKATPGAEKLLAESQRRRRERTREQEVALAERKRNLAARAGRGEESAAAKGKGKGDSDISAMVAKLKAVDVAKKLARK